MTASGFYHCSVKPVGRTNGRSIVAAAAYRSGERLSDEITGQVVDYRARGGVLDTFILTRDAAPAWGQNRERLWNEAERVEARANGRLATEFELALPHELTDAQRKELLADYLRPLIARHGVAADVAIHAPGEDRDHRNIHAHVLLTHRELGADGFGDIANQRTMTRKRKGREVQEKVAGIAATPADIVAIRKGWEQAVNRAYERAGLDIRVDHRSHEERGIEQEPTKHLGPTATEMERRGAESERGDANREITQRNADRVLAAMRETEASQIVAEITSLKADLAMQDARAAAQGRTDDTRAGFTAAAARTTEPAAEIFDRDAANREWEEKVAAAGIAKDEAARAAPEGRQRHEPDIGRETRAAAAEPSHDPQEPATSAAQPVPATGIRSPDRVAGRIFGGLAAMAETMLGGILSFFGDGEPKLTAQQARDKARAEGNEETLHARAAAEAEQATRADQDWRIFEQNSQQRQQQHDAEMGLSERFSTPPPSSGRARDDKGYERER